MARRKDSWTFQYRIITSLVLCMIELTYIISIGIVLLKSEFDCNVPLRLWLSVLCCCFIVHLLILITSEMLTPVCSQSVLTPTSIISGAVNFLLTFFSIVWFIMGNFWYYKADEMCATDFPDGYSLVFIILVINYVFLGTACCYGCVLIYQIAIGVGVTNRSSEY